MGWGDGLDMYPQPESGFGFIRIARNAALGAQNGSKTKGSKTKGNEIELTKMRIFE